MNSQELERLYRKHSPQMYRLARALLHDADEARDVVSDVFAGLLRKQEEVRTDTEESYLMLSTRNRCINLLREQQRHQEAIKILAIDTSQISQYVDEEDERLQRLRHFVEHELLPPSLRRTFELRYRYERKYREIADELGISETSVYNQLSEAFKQIRKHFSRMTNNE